MNSFFRTLLITTPAIAAGLIVKNSGGDVIGSPLLPLVIILLAITILISLKSKKTLNLTLLITVAVVVRALFLFFPESDDMYRYLWEGFIQNKGFNPFFLAPNSTELNELRPWFHSLINHPNIAAIYGPFAQLLFRAFTNFSLSPILFKVMLLIFDFGTVLLLLKLLPIDKKNRIALYLFNPLVLFAVAGEGHLEIIPLFFLVGAYFFFVKQKAGFSFLLLSLAVLTKVNFIIFLPLFITRKNWRSLVFFLLPLVFMIPYISDYAILNGVALKFATEFAWNGPIFTLVSTLFHSNLAYPTVILVALIGYPLIYLSASNRLQLLWGVSALFLLTTPTLHFWYLLMITPFIVLKPSRFWAVLHITILGIGFYFHKNSTGLWGNQTLLQFIAFTPPIILVLVAILFKQRAKQRVKQRVEDRVKQGTTNGSNLSIVLPIYKEVDQIRSRVELLRRLVPKAELIFIDGDSQDGSEQVIVGLGFPYFSCSKGRGIQISEGVRKAERDTVVIMHADSTPSETIFARIEMAMMENSYIGGSCGQSFDSSKSRFSLIQILNRIRASVFGISFGDQLQFFRKDGIDGLFPEYYLMEDVELSLRLKEKGELVYLNNGVSVSTRRWESTGYLKNIIVVLTLLGEFLFKRQFESITDSCKSFYDRYYG
jgi:hypothetical protein